MADRLMKDARVRRTERRLRDAIVSLIHEKSYPAIAGHEILERADADRSAFYAHFRNKNAPFRWRLAPWAIVLPAAMGAVLMSLSTIVVAVNAQLLRRAEV